MATSSVILTRHGASCCGGASWCHKEDCVSITLAVAALAQLAEVDQDDGRFTVASLSLNHVAVYVSLR